MTTRQNHRAGKSLIELMVVMAILSTAMLMIGTVLHGLSRANHAVVTDVRWQRALVELSEQFRRDAHLASTARIAPDGTAVTFQLATTTVEYRSQASHLLRTVTGTPGRPPQDWPTPDALFVTTTIAQRPGVELQVPYAGANLTQTQERHAAPVRVTIRAVLATGGTP